MPRARGSWRTGAVVSFGLHLLVILLIVAPFAAVADMTLLEQGAGGPGPAGGGGGGARGTGAARHEALQYLTIAPPEPAPAEPVIPRAPVPEPLVLPKPELPRVEPPKMAELTPMTGVGGGTGSDGTKGTGQGSGGGVGSGVGTGTGSATGAGTGGGRQENFPPTAMEMFIPPMPVPAAARGFHLVVQFDVDEKGKVRGIEFTPTGDRGYNRRLREVFEGFRFRPGTRPDGTPVRMKYQLEIDLP